MLLEIYNQSNELIRSVEYEMSCYDNDTIRYMASFGYGFKLEGKWLFKPNSLNISKQVCTNCPINPFCNSLQIAESDDVDKQDISDNETSNLVKIPSNTNHQITKIRCIETGKLYDKQVHAARDLNIDPSCVSDSIRTGRPRKGYTFEKVTVYDNN